MMVAPLVLLVDDDPAVAQSVAFALETEGFRVRRYGSAEALLEAVEDRVGEGAGLRAARCLVLDYHLPGLDGLALLNRLRAASLAGGAILITTHPRRGVCEHAARVGAVLLEKPLIGGALLEAVRDACGLSRLASEP